MQHKSINISARRWFWDKIRYKRKINRSLGGDLSIMIFLSVGAMFMGLPILFALSNSLKPLDELWIFPPKFFAINPTFKNFSDLFNLMSNSLVPFSKYILNTIFITVSGTFFHVIFASMCAYPLAKMVFKGRNVVFNIIILALMFNATVTTIPNFMVMDALNLIDTIAAVVIPSIGAPLGLYLMKQFMEQVPLTLLEAARIDGASEWRTFWRIVMPTVKAAWLTLIVFSVQGLWNSGASIFIYREEIKPLAYALSQIATAGYARAGVGAAIAVIMMIVPVSVFVFTQSNIIETMTSSGIKDS
jgi:ABC-type glycerol-3-phosphate transport system permease component